MGFVIWPYKKFPQARTSTARPVTDKLRSDSLAALATSTLESDRSRASGPGPPCLALGALPKSLHHLNHPTYRNSVCSTLGTFHWVDISRHRSDRVRDNSCPVHRADDSQRRERGDSACPGFSPTRMIYTSSSSPRKYPDSAKASERAFTSLLRRFNSSVRFWHLLWSSMNSDSILERLFFGQDANMAYAGSDKLAEMPGHMIRP